MSIDSRFMQALEAEPSDIAGDQVLFDEPWSGVSVAKRLGERDLELVEDEEPEPEARA